MRDFQREGVQPETAHEALRESYRNEDLSKMLGCFIGVKPPPTRKDDMLAALLQLLEGDGLRLIWEKLHPAEQAAAPGGQELAGGAGMKHPFTGRCANWALSCGQANETGTAE